jgi:hypothetical protein
MTDTNDSEIIARLILSTKRKKRNYSLIDIASDISSLQKKKGGLKEVSKIVGISTGMLNQFLSVLKLPSEIQTMVQERIIDSVAMVFLLSKFSNEDALLLSAKAADKSLSTSDLKILLPFRKHHKNENVLELLDKINTSKNIKVSVIKLPEAIVKKSKDELFTIMNSLIGTENIIALENDSGFIEIKITKEGEKILRKKAGEKNKTLLELITTLIK